MIEPKGIKKVPVPKNSNLSRQCCRAGAATLRVEPEPIFYLAGAGAAFFKAPPPAATFWQAKKESLVLLQNMTLSSLQR